MALVAHGHATLRCAIVRRAETSGPPQEARHTCSGVCVPIIRCLPSSPLLIRPSSRSFPPSRSLNLQCVPYSTAGKKKSERIVYVCDNARVSFLQSFVRFVCTVRRNVYEEK